MDFLKFKNSEIVQNNSEVMFELEDYLIITDDMNDETKEIITFKNPFGKCKSIHESLGKEPNFTNYTENFQGCLDYIFHSDNLIVNKVVEPLSKEEASKEKALPSMKYPSDHIVLYAEFSFE